MTVYTFNPLSDTRWDDLVRAHPHASIFHSRGWLEALQRTYGFEPVVFTTSPPGTPLNDGIVLCGVRSWLTGHRLVSVPFADHCDPLLGPAADLGDLVGALRESTSKAWKYAELRPTAAPAQDCRLQRCATFCLHTVDLRGDLDGIHRRMHESTIRRKIRRADRENLRYEEGRSDALLDAFYKLLVLTRKRHNVPPPPKRWFVNLMACVGDAGKIRVAWKDRRPIGSILTLQHNAALVYKYGGSDPAFHNLGAMPFLFWRAIEDANAAGLDAFDLGRSDWSNSGLIAFKERLGGVRSTVTYVRCSSRPAGPSPATLRAPSRVFAWLPEPLLVVAGRLLYRHIA